MQGSKCEVCVAATLLALLCLCVHVVVCLLKVWMRELICVCAGVRLTNRPVLMRIVHAYMLTPGGSLSTDCS